MAAEHDGPGDAFSENAHLVRKALQIMLGKKLSITILTDILLHDGVIYTYEIVLADRQLHAVRIPVCSRGRYQLCYTKHSRRPVAPKNVEAFLLMIHESLHANSLEVFR